MKPTAALVIVLLAGPAALAAQSRSHAMLSAFGEVTRMESVVPSDTERLNGWARGAEGRLGVGVLELSVLYLEGSVGPKGSASQTDLVEGLATLGLRPAAWLAIEVGPHARAETTSAGTQRWLAVEVHARGEPRIVGPALVSYVDLWHSLGGSVNPDGAFGGAQGVAAGLRLRPPHSLVSVSFGYRVDRLNLSGGARSDTIEHLVLEIGLGKP